MSICLYADNAQTFLASAVTSSTTTITLAAGTGALFPDPTTGQFFALSLNDFATEQIYEITYCTARSGDVCTVTRAQEGTAARAWQTNDIAFNGPTSGTTGSAFVQRAGSVLATSTGTANAIVIALNPAITTYTQGFRVQVQANATNTGACTIDAGAGAVSFLRNDGQPLEADDIVSGTIYDAVADANGGPFWMENFVASQLRAYTATGRWAGVAASATLTPGAFIIDTRTGIVTITLTASPNSYNNYQFWDYFGAFGVNSLIVNPGSNKIGPLGSGASGTFLANIPGARFSVLWDTTTNSWVVSNDV